MYVTYLGFCGDIGGHELSCQVQEIFSMSNYFALHPLPLKIQNQKWSISAKIYFDIGGHEVSEQVQ